MGWGLWRRLRRCGGWWAWADALCLHVGHQLVRDLSQHVPGQAGHAQDMVAGAVHIVPEGHKLTDRKLGSGCGIWVPSQRAHYAQPLLCEFRQGLPRSHGYLLHDVT